MWKICPINCFQQQLLLILAAVSAKDNINSTLYRFCDSLSVKTSELPEQLRLL